MSLIRARYRAVNTIMNLPRGGYVGLLDLFPNAAAAYSLRKLRAAYSGSAVRVRRSSDNTEQDIGFTAQGELDTTSLLSFVNEDVVVYTSDFSSTDDLSEANGTGAAAQSVGGVDNAYEFTLTGGNVGHQASRNTTFTVGQQYIISFDYYIPSTNSEVTSIGLTEANEVFGGQDEWKSAVTSEFTATSVFLRFRPNDTGFIPIDADGDVFYLKNIVITQTTADGHVTTWYDQSLSNDATQTTAANQPKIVSAGSLVTENGKAAIDFDGVNDNFDISNFTSVPTISQFNVLKPSATNVDETFTSIQNATITDGIFLGQGNLGTQAKFGLRNFQGADVADSGIAITLQQYLVAAITTSTTAQIYANGVAGAISAKARGNVGGDTQIGANGASGNSFSGKFQEIIIFASNQSANRTGIETNINNFYSIYP